MYKNVLIISDNNYLCNQFESLLIDNNFYDTNWTFAISPFSNMHEFKFEENVKPLVYNMKNNEVILEIISTYDLVFSIHCKQLFPSKLVSSIKCINIHPGYNPINRGWYPQVFAIINNLPVGATIHEIDEKLDHGPIIARELVVQEITDTSESLYKKIISKEMELIKNNIQSILNNTYKVFYPEGEGNLFLKKDFENLCYLDNDEKLTVIELVNRIRALTHGGFKNAYFLDPESGKKVYLTIKLSAED